ncbi:TPA: hypothetical protein ACGAD2_004421 [Salmonella enterica subsp. enterica serovar Newport]
MLNLERGKRRVIFSGQNSHGSNESWYYRMNLLSQIPKNNKVAVVIECPTIDLILHLLRMKKNIHHEMDYSFLLSSTYWWMRSIEFASFLRAIPRSFSVYGIDVPVNLNNYSKYIDSLTSITFPEKKILLSLMEYDINHNNIMSVISAKDREVAMNNKLSLIMEGCYDLIFVVCHNFHASKKSWLNYPSLCQLLRTDSIGNYSIYSSAVFSKNMSFIATPDGSSLSLNRIDNVCSKVTDDNWLTKMVSSLYRSEEKDVLSLTINTPKHFDEIIIYPKGHAIKVGIV